MELSSLLSIGSDSKLRTQIYEDDTTSNIHTYQNQHSMADNHSRNGSEEQLRTPPTTFAESYNNITHHYPPASMSPYGVAAAPKSVAFELLFPNSPQYRARLPMRVQIFPHDTTDSIVTTVKNFYGLYAGPAGAKGVSFEDEQGNTLIARYENLRNNMTVYVRVIDEARGASDVFAHGSFDSDKTQQTFHNGNSNHMAPPHPNQVLSYGQPQGRPTSRSSRKRSISPHSGRGRRSASASTNGLPGKKQRSRSGYKSRGSSTHGGNLAELHSDGLTGYSSGDGAASGSVSSRTKSEHLGNTEISLDNIVEGGRRKRAKFESSELPLFAPPQMPAAASNSSVSPQRRLDPRQSIAFTHPSQHPFANAQMLHSPQSYGNNYGQPEMYNTPAAQVGRRTRGDGSHPQSRSSIGTTPNSGVLPTPDPTVGSCMSEEDKDVALQLMRLGDMSNISHGRTSASTLDDTFSGKADAASSTGATSDSESESEVDLPPMRPHKRESSPILPPGSVRRFKKHLDDILPSQDTTEPSGDEADSEDGPDANFKPEAHEDFMNDLEQIVQPKTIKPKSSSHNSNKSRSQQSIMKSAKVTKPHKAQRPSQSSKSKSKSMSVSTTGSKAPISPTSLPSQSRKASVASTLNFQHQLGDDEEDLSSKPRCQRCRKSKKGCDRQRPCQRCKDAGLSADQCVSEDEGNGRKGRYGRHMGVPVKKDELQAQTIYPPGMVVGDMGSIDKSKKRKR